MREVFKYKNYDKYPKIQVKGCGNAVSVGYDEIAERLKKAVSGKKVLVLDCYVGVETEKVRSELEKRIGGIWINAEDCAYPPEKVDEMLYDYLGEDRVFGFMCHKSLSWIFDAEKISSAKTEVEKSTSLTVVYGVGASLITEGDVYVYADMARWEIQNRYKAGASNFRTAKKDIPFLSKYKRGFFVEWRMCDREKKTRFDKMDFVLDTNGTNGAPAKLIDGESFREGLRQASRKPFRLVPYFDPGVWGGQWMKEVCDLDRSKKNFAWSFDGVPEENSVYLQYGSEYVEVPSSDIVFYRPHQLLGERVHGRFGDEFPIRFDFLDTMGGGNLSLQVHPLTEYIQDKFGMNYTQDESYYILDCDDDTYVYLGVKDNVDPKEMRAALEAGQRGEGFDAEKYANKIPVKRHSHVLIPAGTLHCSGKDTMVLEISATPYIFTFKMWDWGRVGLDGLPRPTHIEHGMKNVQFDRTPRWVDENLVDRFEILEKKEGELTERTGLHEREFIETVRYTVSKSHLIKNFGSVNMCNLVKGSAAEISSPNGEFEPYIVHYAETFIVPGCIKEYLVSPVREGEEIAVLQARVR